MVATSARPALVSRRPRAMRVLRRAAVRSIEALRMTERRRRCRPDPAPARVVQLASKLSVYQQIMRCVPIRTATGAHAEYVYDVSGYYNGRDEVCHGCGARGACDMWHEWKYAPALATENHGRQYAVQRMLKVCKQCVNAIKALPLGTRFMTRH